ncbi:MAG TPA: hypothetical protein VM223_27090 [Planctomycetota bacterium]|nr:hypothetical protein [Planctomycetota bacterium]HUX00713.1 hypothetical protein [Phycisphaerae bacterium]
MSKPDDGGPIQGRLEQAYAIGPDGKLLETHDGQAVSDPVRKGGFTVRDGFAVGALIGELASQDEKLGFFALSEAGRQMLASRCFDMADAMIAERKREAPE